MKYQEILKLIDDTSNDDENIERLEKAVEYFCGTYSKCYAFKLALQEEITDQYENHPEDQEQEHLDKLHEILTK